MHNKRARVATGDLLFDPREAADRAYCRDEDHLALMMELLGPMPVSMTLRGVHTSRFFEREGKHLRRIKQLKFWPLGHVLVEKYDLDPAEVRALRHHHNTALVFMQQCVPVSCGVSCAFQYVLPSASVSE